MANRDLLWTIKYPFHLYSSERTSETKDKRPNSTIKDFPIAIFTWENPRILEEKHQKSWRKTKSIWEIYFSHLNDQIDIFFIKNFLIKIDLSLSLFPSSFLIEIGTNIVCFLIYDKVSSELGSFSFYSQSLFSLGLLYETK